SGTAGITGVVSEANSLVGAHPDDRIGNFGVGALSTGNYLVVSSLWNGARGAVTLGNGTTGTTGPVSEANSLVGNPGDQVGFGDVTLLNNGNYVVYSQAWNGFRGAVTWGSGTTAVTGLVSAANSLVAVNPGDFTFTTVTPLSNGNYLVVTRFWTEARGA